MPAVVPEPPPKPVPSEVPPPCMMRSRWHACPELHKAMDGVTYIADHTRKEEDSTRVSRKYFIYLHLFPVKFFYVTYFNKASFLIEISLP